MASTPETEQHLCERLAAVENELEKTKRELTITTNKLKTLLQKRGGEVGASVAQGVIRGFAPCAAEVPSAEVESLRKANLAHQQREQLLLQQLSASAQQYERLRVMTLEGFRENRPDAWTAAVAVAALWDVGGVAVSSGGGGGEASGSAASGGAGAADPPAAALLEALRMALHVEPSSAAPASGSEPPIPAPRREQEGPPPGPHVARPVEASTAPLGQVPVGYVPGAISIEPTSTKRQRSSSISK
jgi:hypothetical protein